MDCFIAGLVPNPVAVHDGDTRSLTITITSMISIGHAELEIENRQPEGADVLLNDRSGDKITTFLGGLPAGDSDHTVSLGLRLQPPNALSGAIIGLIARVVPGPGQSPISPDKPFLATIGAAGR
jgi:hypothetical protein